MEESSTDFRPTMKMREGNVFTGVCNSVQGVSGYPRGEGYVQSQGGYVGGNGYVQGVGIHPTDNDI